MRTRRAVIGGSVAVVFEPFPRPEGAIDVAPGESIQAAVDANAAGSKFWLLEGVHVNQSVVPKAGIFLGSGGGAVLDGGGTVAHAVVGTEDNIVISALEIRNYVPAQQRGAIHPQAGDNPPHGENWEVAHCNVHDNAWYGVRVAPRMFAHDNELHHNGQMGIGGTGDDIVVEDNEVHHNNPGDTDPLVEASGSKFAETTNLIVRRNWYHHNNGPGIWTDINPYLSLIEDNVVEDNTGPGIEIEISYDTVVQNNVVKRCGGDPMHASWYLGAGILVYNSTNVEVLGNTVEACRSGIAAVDQVRGVGTRGEWWLHGLYVHDNLVRWSGATALTSDAHTSGTTNVYAPAANNRFENNDYRTASGAPFPGGNPFFDWGEVGVTNWAGWQAHGQDLTGSFV